MAPLLLGVFGFIGVFSTIAQPVAQAASNNSTMNFQMRLLNSAGGLIPDGNYNIEFKLYDSANSTGSSQGSCTGDAHCLWTETYTSGNAIKVVNGYMNAQLGSITSFGTPIKWNQPLWLGVRVGGTGTPSWEAIELTSDGTATGNKIALTSVPSAFTANNLSSAVSTFQQTLQFASSFAQATTITLPDPGASSATICYQTATACGFESTSGTDFIKNQSASAQTANFNIQSAATGTVAAVIQGASGQTADLLDIKNGTTVLSVGNNGQTLLKPTSGNDSTSFFQIQPAASATPTFVVDTSNGRVGIGKSSPAQALDVVGAIVASTDIYAGGNVKINNTSQASGAITKLNAAGAGGVTALDVVVINSSSQVVDTTTARDTRVYGVATTTVSVGTQTPVAINGDYQVKCTGTVAVGDQLVTSTTSGAVATDNSATTGILGTALSTCSSNLVSASIRPVSGQNYPRFQNSADSATSFQVQNANGDNVLTVDTSGTQALLGKASTITGKLGFYTSTGANTITIVGPGSNPTGNYTITIPTITANANLCTDNSICSGYAPATGSTHYLAKDATDTASASVGTGSQLYSFTNSNGTPTTGGVLSLNNQANTGATLSATTSGNPSTAVILASNTNASPTGNLIDLQSGSSPTSKFSVSAAGVVTASGDVTAGKYNTNTFNGTTLTFGSATDTISGPGSLTITSGGSSDLTLNSLSGTLKTGTNTNGLLFTNSGAASIDATSGQNLNLGTSASNHTTTLGSTNGTSTTTVQSGSGGITLSGNTSVSSSNTLTVNSGLTSLGGGLTVNKTLTTNSGSTQNVQSITFASPADSSGTNISQGLNISPTIGNATAGTNTANIFNIGAVTGDAQVSLNAINVGALTGTAATENAINIGAGWDAGLVVNGTTVVDGSGNISTARLSGNYVASTTNGTGISATGNCSSNACAATINIDQSASLTWTGLEKVNNNNAAGFQVSDSSSSKSVLTVDTSGDQVLLGKAGASGLNGLLTFNNGTGTNTAGIQLAGNPTSSYVLQLPTAAISSNQCLGSGTVSGADVPLVFIGCGINAVGTIDTPSKSSDGAHISGASLILQTADASFPGLLSATAQTIAGAKTFNNGLILNDATTDLTTASNGDLTIAPNGTGDLVFTGDDDSNARINSTISTDVSQNGLAISLTDNANASTGTLYGLQILNNDNNANTGVPDALADIRNANANETVPDGLLVEQAGGGTLTSGIEVKQNTGTLTNGLTFTGTFTKLINSTGFNVTGAGAVTAASVDAGSGLIQTTGTVDANIFDRSSSGSLQVGTGVNTTAISLGNSSAVTTAAGGLTVTSTKFLTVNGDAFSDLTGTGLKVTSNALTIDTAASLTWTGTEAVSNHSTTGFQVSDSTASKSVLTVDTSGDQVILGKAGASGLTGILSFNNSSNAFVASIQAGVTASPGYTLTLPTAIPGSGTQCLASDNTGALSFITCSGAATSIGAFSTSNHYNDGAQITSNVLTLGDADISHPGLVDTTTQTFAGSKTFTNGDLLVKNSSNTAFQVQNSGGTLTPFVVNTNANEVDLGLIGSAVGSSAINIATTSDSTNTQAVAIGSNANAGNSLSLEAGNTGLLNIGNSTSAHTINIGANASTTNAQTVVLGSATNTTSTLTLQGGNNSATAIVLQTGNNGSTTAGGITIGNTTGAFTQTINIGTNGTASSTTNVIIGSSIAGTTTIQSGTTNINSATISTSQTSLGLFNTNAATVTMLQAATSISLGATTGTLSVRNANTTLGNAAGSGVLTNNGATLNSTLALSNFNYTGSGNTGTIGSNTSTVDIYTSISINQTQSPVQTLTIPAPTASTSYGRLLYLSNIGTASFIVSGVSINPGQAGTLVWANTNGAASWQFAGAGADSIANQNSNDQTANFRISGTGRANTSFTTPLIDSITGGLGVGTSTATSVTVGNTAHTTAISLQGTAGLAVTVGNAAGSGVLTNNGATLNTTLALGDLAAGSIGANTATVDIYTSFSIAPSASGRAYTIPTPTASSSYGRIIYVSNIASTGNYFTIGGIRIPPGSTGTLVWSNSNGTASWQFAGAGGASIENQSSADQVATFRIGGSGTIDVSSTTAFQVQDGSANPVFTVNTSGGVIQIGSSTSNTGTQVLALNNNNGTTTPTEVDGGMYYNNATSQFMCGENGFWVSCGVPPRDHSYDLYDEFMSGVGGTGLATGTTGIGGLNWYNSTIVGGSGSPSLIYQYNQTTGNAPAADANRPGIIDVEQSGSGNNTGQTLSLGLGSMKLGTSLIDMKTAVNITGSNMTVVVGITNETTSTSAPTTGVYWKEAGNGTWQYCYVNGSSTEVCANSSTTATAGSWYKLEIQVVSSTEVDYYVNGTKVAVTGITYNTTNKVAPSYTMYKTTGTNNTLDLYIDYFELLGTTTTAR